ncbi:MAG: hypothetical protein JWR61_1120 [Ferruginibacter sp.]|uniref:hypothetical protein n=1 Tax=Ferruginibacter sp. TaxID=1940288 RepID=UPI002658E73B|nr:hypothetical protein [Ferruginibacter sp.]MDB5276165.1 hypothetical protein [Ferruginibacter sp.]
MITKGVWTGHYDHAERTKTLISGLTSTKFTIEIIDIIDNRFTGTVQDDLATGGTEGVGKIIGAINANKIKFTKLMPIMTLIMDKNGTRKVLKKKHRPIYYSGDFSTDKIVVSGEWHFKPGIIWLGFLPRFVTRQGGTWTMSRN